MNSFEGMVRISPICKKKVVVFSAEAFGFGPASLAICVAQSLRKLDLDSEFWFLGSGVAQELAQTSGLFSRFIDHEPTRSHEPPHELVELGGSLAYFVSAVSPDAVRLAQKLGANIGYIEPLLWFFPDTPSFLSEVRHFFVQDFQSTQKHIERLQIGHYPIVRVGWVLPTEASPEILLAELGSFGSSNGAPLPVSPYGGRSSDYWLVNFGGVENVLTGSSEYPVTIVDILLRAQQTIGQNVPLICIGGGKSVRDLSARYGVDKVCWSGSVSPHWAQHLVREAKEYFLSCGLASLVELSLMRSDGFGLPSQNYSQHLQIRSFRSILSGWSSFDWCDSESPLLLAPYLPEAEGVERIANRIRQLPSEIALQEEILGAIVEYVHERQNERGTFTLNDPNFLRDISGAYTTAQEIYRVISAHSHRGLGS